MDFKDKLLLFNQKKLIKDFNNKLVFYLITIKYKNTAIFGNTDDIQSSFKNYKQLFNDNIILEYVFESDNYTSLLQHIAEYNKNNNHILHNRIYYNSNKDLLINLDKEFDINNLYKIIKDIEQSDKTELLNLNNNKITKEIMQKYGFIEKNITN